MASEDYAVGVKSQLYVLAGSTVRADAYTYSATSGTPFDFLSENVHMKKRIVGGNEIRGTRVAPSIRTRYGANYYQGVITKYISPGELDVLIPLFLGPEGALDVFSAAEEIPYCSMLVDRDSGAFSATAKSTWQYDNVKIDKVIFRGRAPRMGETGEPELITMEIHVIGSKEALVTKPTVAAFSAGATYAPYVFSDGVLTMVATARPIEEFILMFDNGIEAKYVNSVTPYALRSTTRNCMLRVLLPWSDATDELYGQALAGATGSLVFTNGAYVTTFTFGTLQVEDITPTVSNGRGQIKYQVDAVARSITGTAYDVQITNDITP